MTYGKPPAEGQLPYKENEARTRPYIFREWHQPYRYHKRIAGDVRIYSRVPPSIRAVSPVELRQGLMAAGIEAVYADTFVGPPYNELGTTAGDGDGIDVWLGTRADARVTGIACTVDDKRRCSCGESRDVPPRRPAPLETTSPSRLAALVARGLE
jgi:hypothetical protein